MACVFWGTWEGGIIWPRAVMGRRGLLWKQIGGEKHLQWVGISAAMVCAGELGKCKEQQAYLCKGGG